LGDFFGKAMDYVRGWSIAVDPARVNYTAFALQPSIPLKLDTSAYNWARSNVFVRTETSKTISCFYIQPAASSKKLTMAETKQYDKLEKLRSWKFFDTYVTWQSKLWKVIMEADDYQNAACSCPSYQKKFMCKHILGIAIGKKLYAVPPAVKDVPIGEKRKRGRPKKCSKALLR